jgi:hypothetical protein
VPLATAVPAVGVPVHAEVAAIVYVLIQPVVLFDLVITLVPKATPETIPLVLIVATEGVPLNQAVPPLPVNVDVPPTHTVAGPVITGIALTVRIRVLVQPVGRV